MAITDFLEKGGDLLLSGVDRFIDRETREQTVVPVNNPTTVVAAENTGAAGQPGLYAAGTTAQPMQIAGMPWNQALLIGSVGLLALGIIAKVVMR